VEVRGQTLMNAVSAPPSGRIGYLDGLRGCLSVLVILHHVAITYGAEGSWYYREQVGGNLGLTTFAALNQFYFMGLFFLLAAVFTPGSLLRRGVWAFLRERCLRLGLPLVLFALFFSPPLEYVAWVTQGGFKGSFFAYLALSPPLIRDFAPGPLWFVETLFAFSLITLVPWRLGLLSTTPPEKVTVAQVIGFSAVLAVLSFLVRLVYPIGATVWHLQLAYFPQYVLLFTLGVRAGSAQVFERLPRQWFWPCMALSLAGALLVPIVVLINGGVDGRFLGGLSWQAVVVCLLEAVVCPAASIAMILLFRDRIPAAQRWWSVLGENSYAVYIVHAPVCVLLSLAVRDMAIPLLAKFLLVSVLGVGLALGCAVALRHWGGRAVRSVVG
jgi:peptidoglycan/LPS O-acetylase OafA/YrhL